MGRFIVRIFKRKRVNSKEKWKGTHPYPEEANRNLSGWGKTVRFFSRAHESDSRIAVHQGRCINPHSGD